MPNNFVNTSWVSMEVLRLLVNELEVAAHFNTDWEKDFKKDFAVGETIQVKYPQRYTIRDGLGYNPQGLSRLTTTVSLDQPIGIDFEFDDVEKALKMERSREEISKQYLEPAAAQLAQEIDSRAAKFAYQNASNVVGALATDPTTVATYYQARQRLKELAVPPGDLGLCVSSSMMQSLGANITTFFHPADELSKMFKRGYLGQIAGFDVYECNSLYSHTAGTWAASVTVTSANQSGSSLTITATAADTFNVGDKFSIANVNQVNPMTRRIPGKAVAKQFTVSVALTAAGGGADVLNFLPAIYGPGSQYQNVDALPAAGAALTLWPGTSTPNGKVGTVGLGLSKYAFALVGAKLYSPEAVESCSQQQDPNSGLAIRKVHAWDPVRSMNVNRYDMLFGMGNLYQDNGAVCVAGA